jgi:hypothetical protein
MRQFRAINFSAIALFLVVTATQASVFADEPAREPWTPPQKIETDIAVSPVVQPGQKLTDIRRIFVAPLGTAEGSELIRQKAINRLIKSGIVTVVDSAEDADAVLTGTTEINHRHNFGGSIGLYGGFVSGRTRYSAESVVRLVGKNKQVLWADEATSRWFFASHTVRGASSNVADKMVKSLIEAIAPDKTQIASKKPSVSQP